MPQFSSIAVLGGAGHHGRGIVQHLARAGVRVTIGSRDPSSRRAAVAAWSDVDTARISVVDNRDAVASADLIVVAVPFPSLADLLREVAPAIALGSLVVDVTVPVAFVDRKLTMIEIPEGSATQHVRALLPPTVSVAGTLKTLPAETLARAPQSFDCDEFVCGDSAEAITRAADLIRLFPGLRAVDVGPLSRARWIEHMTALAIAINRRHHIRDARFRVVGLS